MIHFAFLIHLISVATGYCAIMLASFFYYKLKKSVILYYLLFILSLVLISSSLAVDHYLTIISAAKNNGQNMVVFSISAMGCILCIVVLPILIHLLTGTKGSKLKIGIFGTIDLVLIVSTVVYFIIKNIAIIQFILQPILFGIILYTLMFMIVSVKKVGNTHLQKNLRPFLIVGIICTPLIIADAFLGTLPFLPYNMSVPIFFLAIHDICIFFILNYLNEPPFLKQNHVTEHFILKFNITKREIEVIQSMITGKSNREISNVLFISPKTVENHLSSIYAKTSCKNRVQLVSLLQGNKS